MAYLTHFYHFTYIFIMEVNCKFIPWEQIKTIFGTIWYVDHITFYKYSLNYSIIFWDDKATTLDEWQILKYEWDSKIGFTEEEKKS
jgi:hypothetical protein